MKQWMAEQNPHNVRQCPVCGTVSIRAEGCKFMTCKSDRCAWKTFFCMCCGKQLTEKHEDHKCEVEGKDYQGSRLAHNCSLM